MLTAVITGANSGIGKETVLALVQADCYVVMLCRSEERAQSTQAEITERFPDAQISYVCADLSDMNAVRNAAVEIQKHVDKIDILVNNAGVMQSERCETIDGFEETLAVNHFAPFLLTHHLLPLLKKAGVTGKSARIINVASRAHKRVPFAFEDLMYVQRKYVGWKVYCQSKLANILYTQELSKRLENELITVNCLHPGVVNTGFLRNVSGVLGKVLRLIFSFQLTPIEGAKTSIYLALDSQVEGTTGQYYDKCQIATPSKEAQNGENAQRLWEYTEAHLATFLS